MKTFRIRCGGKSADIVAESAEDAVARVKDIGHFQMPGRERSFQVYEIVRFDKERFAGGMAEQQKQWYGAEERFIDTIIIPNQP